MGSAEARILCFKIETRTAHEKRDAASAITGTTFTIVTDHPGERFSLRRTRVRDRQQW
jgi:hypothetical protein